jgi:hypothetical protein
MIFELSILALSFSGFGSVFYLFRRNEAKADARFKAVEEKLSSEFRSGQGLIASVLEKGTKQTLDLKVDLAKYSEVVAKSHVETAIKKLNATEASVCNFCKSQVVKFEQNAEGLVKCVNCKRDGK